MQNNHICNNQTEKDMILMTAKKKRKGIIIIIVCLFLTAFTGILIKKFVFTPKTIHERVEVMIYSSHAKFRTYSYPIC